MEFAKRFFVLLSFLRLRKHARSRTALPTPFIHGIQSSTERMPTKNIPVFY